MTNEHTGSSCMKLTSTNVANIPPSVLKLIQSEHITVRASCESNNIVY